MVDRKRRKIAKKPQAQSNPDSWVTEGGVDPEINLPASSPAPTPVIEDKDQQQEENEKSYPHRISFDLDNSQYKKLKWASFDSDRPMNDILREALKEWIKSRNY